MGSEKREDCIEVRFVEASVIGYEQLQVGQNVTTEVEKMACTWFGEVPSCCSLILLLSPAWVLLKYVLQTIFSGPVPAILCY